MFHIGQRVVCVDDKGLTAGRVYTVREVTVSPIDNSEAIRLIEIIRPIGPGDGGNEPPYRFFRFRPVDETRLEVFRAMLVTPPRELVPAGDEAERRKVNGWEAA